MKTNIFKYLFLIFVFILFITIVVFAIKTRPSAQSKSGATVDFSTRLKQVELPVKTLNVLSQSPPGIQIVLQSSSNTQTANDADFWHKHVAAREAELAYLPGYKIDWYQLEWLNSQGETISSEQVFLNPGFPSQSLQPVKQPGLDLVSTKELLEDQMDLYGMQLAKLDVVSDAFVRSNTKLVKLNLVAPATIDAQQSINSFIPALKALIKKLNEESQTQIALVRARIFDDQNNLIIDHILDNDLGSESTLTAQGFTAEWMPRPAPIENLLTPSPTLPPTQPPGTPYPNPSPVPTVYP